MRVVRWTRTRSPILAAIALAAVTGGAAAIGPRPAPACDFCFGGGPKFRSLQTEVEESGSVVLGSLLRRVGRKDVIFRIDRVAKGGEGLALGSEVRLDPGYALVHPGLTYLLLGEGPDLVGARVMVLEERSQSFLDVALKLPAREQSSERLRILTRYLADSDPFVAASARQEFADAPYAAVKALKPHLVADDLVRWLESPATPIPSRGVLLLMLGVSGTKEHLPVLEHLLAMPAWQQKPSYDALIAAYLMLSGADGVARVQQVLDEVDADHRSRPVREFMRALRFHEREEKVLTDAQVVGALRDLLRYPKVAESTLFELTRHGDWASLERVMEMYEHHHAELPWLRRLVREYLTACPRPEAKQHLARLSKRPPR